MISNNPNVLRNNVQAARLKIYCRDGFVNNHAFQRALREAGVEYTPPEIEIDVREISDERFDDVPERYGEIRDEYAAFDAMFGESE